MLRRHSNVVLVLDEVLVVKSKSRYNIPFRCNYCLHLYQQHNLKTWKEKENPFFNVVLFRGNFNAVNNSQGADGYI